MSYIVDLAPELQIHIARNLVVRDLINLSITCTSLRSVLEPDIYRTIGWTWHHSGKTTSRPIHALLRNLLNKPKRALWVQNANFQELGYGDKPLLSTAQFSNEEVRSIRLLLENAQFPDIEEWMGDIRHGSIDAILAVILVQLCNLKSLTIDLFLRHDDDLAYITPNKSRIGQVLRHASSAPVSASLARLSHLEQLEWPSPNFPGPMCFLRPIDIDDALSLLGLPVLQKYSVKIDQQPPGRFPKYSEMKIQAKHLTTLRLRFSTVSFTALEGILSSTPSLTVLDMECSRDMGCLEAGDLWSFNGEALRIALNRCNSTLKSLRMVCTVNDPMLDIPVSEFFPSPLGSLSQLCNLEVVEMCLPLLIGIITPTVDAIQTAMPASLERITIREDGYDLIGAGKLKDVVSELAIKDSSNPPRLKQVGLCVDLESWDRKEIGRIQDSFRDSRLELLVQHSGECFSGPRT
ncbi:hypothetical protein IQ06DRAFT_104912 [Phaeosphaeriaceae sp. SRC1lsM3a]|nr:hypothetical protein IQ06DRAFT_104912 [Stagonospora sp. SRC1lsM3a]